MCMKAIRLIDVREHMIMDHENSELENVFVNTAVMEGVDDLFSCKHCKKVSNNKEDIKSHIMDIHMKEKTDVNSQTKSDQNDTCRDCRFCSKTFKIPELINHVESEHKEIVVIEK